MNNLFGLPRELFLRILELLPPRAFLNTFALNHWTRSLFLNDPFLQLYVHSTSACLKANHNTASAALDKFEILSKKVRAWDAFCPQSVIFSDCSSEIGDAFHLSDLTSGIYATLEEDPESGIKNTINFQYFRNSTRSRQKLKVLELQCPKALLHFKIFPDQDLIAAVFRLANNHLGVDIRLFHLSTGKYHSRANQAVLPLLEWGTSDRQRGNSVRFKAFGDILAITANGVVGETDLFMYKWTTTELLMHLAVERANENCFSFLSRDTIIVTNAENRCLDFWRIPTSSAETNLCFLSIGLPEIRFGGQINRFTIYSPKTNSKSAQAFSYSAEGSLYLFGISAADFQQDFVVSQSSLLEFIPDDLSPSTIPRIVPWSEWGHSMASWLPVNPDQRSILVGSRFIYDSCNREKPIPLTVRDYNPYYVRRMLRGTNLPQNVTVVSSSVMHTSSSDRLFSRGIRSWVPYVETVTGDSLDFAKTIVDDEHVVGFEPKFPGSEEWRMAVLYMG